MHYRLQLRLLRLERQHWGTRLLPTKETITTDTDVTAFHTVIPVLQLWFWL